MMTLAGVRASDTLAHELLRVEHEANGEPEAAFAERLKRLNLLIDEAVNRVKALKVDDSTPKGIKAIFAEIDQVLVDNHYNVFINTRALWDAMTPGIPNSGGIRLLTEKMKEHRKKYPDAVYYRFDCDTVAIFYLGVFDRLNKPVVMVETPKHEFLRWRISGNKHVNWDVNDARSYTDEEYRSGRPRIANPFDKETEIRNHFLQDMSRDETKSHHRAIAAELLRDRAQFEKAIEFFEGSIKQRPYAAMPRNNLAWMIATQPDLQRNDLLDRALVMAQTAVALMPTDGNLVDTLAAVHAARHEFEKAIEIERGGRNRADRIKAYKDKKTPSELDWRFEPNE